MPFLQGEATDSAGGGIVRGCDWCIATHVKKAMEAGATKDEIVETCFVAMVMGGSPALAYTKVAMDVMKELGSG